MTPEHRRVFAFSLFITFALIHPSVLVAGWSNIDLNDLGGILAPDFESSCVSSTTSSVYRLGSDQEARSNSTLSGVICVTGGVGKDHELVPTLNQAFDLIPPATMETFKVAHTLEDFMLIKETMKMELAKMDANLASLHKLQAKTLDPASLQEMTELLMDEKILSDLEVEIAQLHELEHSSYRSELQNSQIARLPGLEKAKAAIIARNPLLMDKAMDDLRYYKLQHEPELAGKFPISSSDTSATVALLKEPAVKDALAKSISNALEVTNERRSRYLTMLGAEVTKGQAANVDHSKDDEYFQYVYDLVHNKKLLAELMASGSNPVEQEKGLEPLWTAQCRLLNRVGQNEMISQRNFLVGSSLLTVATLGAGALASGVGEATLLARGITVGSELAGMGFVGQGLREKWAKCGRMAEGLKTTAGNSSATRRASFEAYAACEREFETEAILAALGAGGSASVVTAGASWQGAQRVLSKVGSNARSLGLKLSTNTTKKIEGIVARMLRSGRSEAAIESEVRGVLSACRAP